MNTALCSSVPMKHSHCCSRARSMPLAGARSASRKALGDVLQDRGVLGEELARVGAQGRHHAERVDGDEVGAVRQALVAVALDVLRFRAGLVKCDAGCHRAGERGEIKLHGNLPRFDFCTVPH